MGKIFNSIVGGMVFGIAGCATHPLPEDFAIDNTRRIVEKVRCEIRTALFDELTLAMQRKLPKLPGQPERQMFGPYVAKLGAYLEDKHELIKYLSQEAGLPDPVVMERRDGTTAPPIDIPDDLAGRPLPQIFVDWLNGYLGTSIAYEFRFVLTESNDATANASFVMPFTNGSFTLGLKGGNERERKNERKVSISDSFKSFHQMDCDEEGHEAAQYENQMYPITGRVGMKEVIFSYTRVLSDVNRTQSSFTSLTDKLTFTTLFVATATPKLVLMPGFLDSFKLASADLNVNVDRTDVHEVQFAITPPSPPTDTIPVTLAPGVKLNVIVPSLEPDGKGRARARPKKRRPRQARTTRRVPKGATPTSRLFKINRSDELNMLRAKQQLDRQILIDRNRRLLETIGE